MIDRTSIEILPADWRTRAKTLRQYRGGTSAVALEACTAELETALRQRDDTILTLTEAAGGKAATLPLTWDAWCARARSRTPEGPAHPGSLEGTSPMRPGRWPSLVWRRSLRCARFRAGRSCSPSSRRVSDDGTKRSRRSYSAGERGRNRVLVFPDPGPVSSGSSGAKADGGLPSRSDIATGTGPRGRRTQSLPAASSP